MTELSSGPRVAASDGKRVSVVSGEAGVGAGSCDILTGFGTFTAAAIINIVPTETSFGPGVNTCQSGSEPQTCPLTQQLQLPRLAQLPRLVTS